MNSEEYRNKIKILYKKGRYHESYKLGRKFCSDIYTEKINSTTDDKKACHDMLAQNCRRLGNLKEAFCNLEQSFKYSETITDKINVLWLKGMCCKGGGQTQQAINMYDEAMLLADKNEMYDIYSQLLHNKANITKDIEVLFQAIELYKKYIPHKLDNIYDSLCELYIDKKQYNKALKYCNKIKDIEKRKEIKKELLKNQQTIRLI